MMMRSVRLRVLAALLAPLWLLASPPGGASPWMADNGDGTYRNPILHADYSDPDVIRVGSDFYMTASSFNAVPGLPLLHSKDLVNWELIGHVYAQQPPLDVYSKPQHGSGAWAPAIRFHNGQFYVFYPDPGYGIYMSKAAKPTGPWSEPLLIKQVKGWIDPCPFWDSDGNAYLVSAMSASRSPLKSSLILSRMAPDGTRLLDEGALVYDGHAQDPTVEGPKLYKRNGYYYIFAPGGGVPRGWQLALRSKHIYGPYERKVVLAQGSTAINGPHQGAWVDTPSGESWFVHFQDKGPYGRVVHLEPLTWVDDWPVIGNHGEPVATYRKPNVGKTYPATAPADSDEFSASELGPQWQWQANPKPAWAFPSPAYGSLRLYAVATPEGHRNLWDVPNLLLQKFPAPEFTATSRITFSPHVEDDQVGLLVMGADYSYISLKKRPQGLVVSQIICKGADQGAAEVESTPVPLTSNTVYLRAHVGQNAEVKFAYSTDGTTFTDLGQPVTAVPGRWIGAKVGLFALGSIPVSEFGYADIDWFRIQ
jgi:beta-xylosidase